MSIAGMLPHFQRSLRPLLTKTCTIKAIADTADASGGYTQSRTATGTVACTYQLGGTGGGGELAYGDVNSYAVVVPIGTSIQVADFIEVDGLMLEVMDNKPHAGLDGLLRLDCVRVAGTNT